MTDEDVESGNWVRASDELVSVTPLVLDVRVSTLEDVGPEALSALVLTVIVVVSDFVISTVDEIVTGDEIVTIDEIVTVDWSVLAVTVVVSDLVLSIVEKTVVVSGKQPG